MSNVQTVSAHPMMSFVKKPLKVSCTVTSELDFDIEDMAKLLKKAVKSNVSSSEEDVLTPLKSVTITINNPDSQFVFSYRSASTEDILLSDSHKEAIQNHFMDIARRFHEYSMFEPAFAPGASGFFFAPPNADFSKGIPKNAIHMSKDMAASLGWD